MVEMTRELCHALPAEPSRLTLRVAMPRAAHQLLDPHCASLYFGPNPNAWSTPRSAAALRSRAFGKRPVYLYLRAFLARGRVSPRNILPNMSGRRRNNMSFSARGSTRSPIVPPTTVHLRFWEIDYPATQAWKRELLAVAGMPIPLNVHFVRHFEHDALPGALAAAGLDATAGTVFSCLAQPVTPSQENTVPAVASRPAAASAPGKASCSKSTGTKWTFDGIGMPATASSSRFHACVAG